MPLHREAMRVDRFGADSPTPARETVARRGLAGRAIVRVTHASVGVTDAMAARGDYLLHPFRGFVPGYDFVGTVEHLPAGDRSGLSLGRRVAAVMPFMGAHADMVSLAPSLLVPVPDELDSPTAATLPLDTVTAFFALDALALDDGASVLVQGASGAVGAWTVQLAAERGLAVYGTASPRSRDYAERLGAEVLDYRDPAWIERLATASGGVSGAIDHTGSRALRRAVRPGGRIVRIAFGGEPGRQRSATATGFLTAAMRRYARPGERVSSVPIIVATRRSAYRRALSTLMEAVATGRLLAPLPQTFPLTEYADALKAANSGDPGVKTVLTMSHK